MLKTVEENHTSRSPLQFVLFSCSFLEHSACNSRDTVNCELR